MECSQPHLDASNNLDTLTRPVVCLGPNGLKRNKKYNSKCVCYEDNNCTSDECVSRDSGFDFEADERMNSVDDINSNHLKMKESPPHSVLNEGRGNSEYTGGSLVKWRLQSTKPDEENGNQPPSRNSLHWDEFFGSSLDLTPTLLGIYDKIASASHNEENSGNDQSDFDYFPANENLEDGKNNRCHSPKPSPPLNSRLPSNRKVRNIHEQSVSGRPDWDQSVVNNNKQKMDTGENESADNKKRPLSISSMSSSSTSSLPRQRKRPNLSEYSSSAASSQLDIEKLDNLLYIDDNPEAEVPEQSADELSLCSEDKRKSGGDSDSQTSTDQPEQDQEQTAEMLNSTLSFHQSDSSLSYAPTDSASCSTADLSLTSDLISCEKGVDRVKRSPSRTSQRSGVMSRSGSQRSGHYVSHVQRVVTELVETERTYVLNLQDIKQGYYEYLRASPDLPISPTDMECLFSNIVQIYDFSCEFLQHLEDCGMDPIKVADCFVDNNAGFVIYAEYCTNYPSAVDVLTRVMCDGRLSEVFKQRQLTLGHGLPLGAFLLKPVQRILKYHLLLQNILKHYKKSDIGYTQLVAAHDHMTAMSHEINEMKRRHEHAVRVQEIQSQLEDYEGEDFTQLGELLLEGSFRMFGVKASRQMFLFAKGVIIAKRKEDGMLSCKAYIPCATLMLVESIPREPLNFQILPFNNPRNAHTIHARNLDQKRKWCTEMKRLIMESFSSKIPDSVKDLVIEKLGKSKDEDALAQTGNADSGKSHVTTPDYLEKRLRARRKSGTALLQGGTPSPKPGVLESLMYKEATHSNNAVEHYGFRNNVPGIHKAGKTSTPRANQENVSPARKSRRPVSIQRSQSFQDSGPAEEYLSDRHGMDAISMDNLINSDGPVIRNPSFRMATQVSPIRFDTTDGLIRESPEKSPENVFVKGVLVDQKNVDNLPPSVRKSIENIDSVDSGRKLTLSPQDVFIDNQENLNGSYLEESSLRKRGRYASMPALSGEPPGSPKISRLHSERLPNSPYQQQKLPVHHARRIDIKPYFSFNKDSQLTKHGGNNEQIGNNLSKDQRQINAFNDTFSLIRKSQENIFDKSMGTRPLALTQPKPFTSTLKSSAGLLDSHARLNKWGHEKFTKGSMLDLSHLKEDPWVPNKQRSYTESQVTVEHNYSPSHDRPSPVKQANKQINRLSLEHSERRHVRTRSVGGIEANSDSADNLDWIVYANRNSIPISDFSTEEMSRKFKYCTPPRGSMNPPPAGSHTTDTTQTKSSVPLPTTPVRQPSYHYNRFTDATMSGDSSISLSATTSSDTCSSPDVLKEAVFDDSSFTRDRSNVSRSFSSPIKHAKGRRHMHDERPASADLLCDADHVSDSEKLVAEMEHYLMRSTSSSGSLSSSNLRFPTSVPTFEVKAEHHHNKNRDSCLSTGSNSSYDSTGELSSEAHSEEGIVDSIKTKISNIASKFTGRRVQQSEGALSNLSTSPSKLSHNLSLKMRGAPLKSGKTDLPTLLREMEPGSEAIGSRMANTDLDDYATFSMSKTEGSKDETKPQQQPRKIQYGRFSTSDLIAKHNTPSHMTFQSESRLCPQVPSFKNISVEQSDSAFSIQSADVDGSSSDDSPRNEVRVEPIKSVPKPDTSDTFYERRLSEALNTEEAFRDSAIYCDEVDPQATSQPGGHQTLASRHSIKSFVQQLEEKNKQKLPPPVKVRPKEPGAMIKQRMESLAASTDYRNKSAATSRSISTTTSLTHSRCSSRATSEEKTQPMTSASLQAYIDSKFPANPDIQHTEDDLGFRGRGGDSKFRSRATSTGGLLKPAFSLGRLDMQSFDVDNLIIMKGWVKELIEKFQQGKK
ncbi:PKHG1-like protein [Mya arenaria]|uniref:PKHG1-like protein n=1 Tax=Mya arenaria TaxID=6604 RepID=A0ABY7F9E3_MYAAR|nr:PKHG1-like protein [Mya arenaria]